MCTDQRKRRDDGVALESCAKTFFDECARLSPLKNGSTDNPSPPSPAPHFQVSLEVLLSEKLEQMVQTEIEERVNQYRKEVGPACYAPSPSLSACHLASPQQLYLSPSSPSSTSGASPTASPIAPLYSPHPARRRATLTGPLPAPSAPTKRTAKGRHPPSSRPADRQRVPWAVRLGLESRARAPIPRVWLAGWRAGAKMGKE